MAGKRKFLVERTAMSLLELLKANQGAEVYITENDNERYPATIAGIPERSAEEVAATSGANPQDVLPQSASIILLDTSEGRKIVPLDRIKDVIFRDGVKSSLATEEFREVLTLHLDWSNQPPAETAQVGYAYVQKGLRMTYTASGATTDLELTAAVDLQVRKEEAESGRTPNAIRWQGDSYARIDLEGTIFLANYLAHPVKVEVNRYVMGNADGADREGTVTMLSLCDDHKVFDRVSRLPWWGWWSWPYWWRHFNGLGRITWTVELDTGDDVELKYSWHYFWR